MKRGRKRNVWSTAYHDQNTELSQQKVATVSYWLGVQIQKKILVSHTLKILILSIKKCHTGYFYFSCE